MRRLIDPSAEPLEEQWRAAREAACAPFTADEEGHLLAVLFDGKPSQPYPALFLFAGPPGSGKSSCRNAAFQILGVDPSHVVLVDSDEMRQFHKGWQQLVQLRDNNGHLIAFTDAQKLGSQACKATKEQLVNLAVEHRKHVLMTTVRAGKRDHLIELAATSGYTLHLIVIAAKLNDLEARAAARAQDGGRVTTPQTADTLEAVTQRVMELLPYIGGSLLILENSGALGCPLLRLKLDRVTAQDAEMVHTFCHNAFGLA